MDDFYRLVGVGAILFIMWFVASTIMSERK